MENYEYLNYQKNEELEELSHIDKLIGIFTEPKRTFEIISKFPMQTIDWLVPIIIVFAIAGLTRNLLMLNDDIVLQIRKQQIEMFDKMVKDGKMTQEQAEQAIEEIDKQTKFMQGPTGWAINIISTMVAGFFFFFIIAGIYFLFIKLTLNGEGNYIHTLVASGLISYITMIQILITTILSFLFGKIVMDTSIANFIELERGSYLRFILSKIDLFSIWAYSVLAIGLGKLNKAEKLTPYFILVFAIWILGGLIFFLLGKAFPFFSGFVG